MELQYTITAFPGHYYKCEANIDDKAICKCQIGVDNRIWTISAWFTVDEYKRKGVGKLTMQYLLCYLKDNFGEPNGIEYIWNGTNQYVYNWIHNCFDAYCKCPIAIQKTQSDDDWSSHIYVLNKDKILEYFNI